MNECLRLVSELQKIANTRTASYGDPRNCHEAIGMVWGGILKNYPAPVCPLPPHIVALMMAGMKLVRAAHSYHPDNFDDATIYISFAREFQQPPK